MALRGWLAGAALVALVVAGSAWAADGEPVRDYRSMPAGTYRLDPNHAMLIWKVSHMGFMDYTARFNRFDARFTYDPRRPMASKVDVVVDTASADTGNKVLDNELDGPKFFNVKKFPMATFKSTELMDHGDGTGMLTGNLTLLGVTRPVTLDFVYHGHGKNPLNGKPTTGFSAVGRIKRSDFGMNFGIPMVGDEVALEIEVEFEQAVVAKPGY